MEQEQNGTTKNYWVPALCEKSSAILSPEAISYSVETILPHTRRSARLETIYSWNSTETPNDTVTALAMRFFRTIDLPAVQAVLRSSGRGIPVSGPMLIAAQRYNHHLRRRSPSRQRPRAISTRLQPPDNCKFTIYLVNV